MRSLVLIAALLWGGVSWWWYTCDIKGYCESDSVQVNDNEKEADSAVALQNQDADKTETDSTVAIDDSKPESSDVTDSTNNEPKTDAITSTSDTAQEFPDTIATTPSDETVAETETETTDVSDVITPESDTADSDVEVAVDTIAETPETETTDNDPSAASADPETTALTTTESTDVTPAEEANQEQADTAEEIVSADDNDPKKIRIDKVDGSTTANIQKARVYFPFSSSKKADLTGSATRYFDQVVEALKVDGNLKIQLTGHTDNQGKAQRNQTLGLRRAETVKKIFIEKGVSASQIKTDSKGEDQPISTNRTEDGRNKNRRVEVEAITE